MYNGYFSLPGKLGVREEDVVPCFADKASQGSLVVLKVSVG